MATTTASLPPTPSASAASKGKQREKPLASLLAGATAGSIEGFVTYPTEFAKTQLQFGHQQALQQAGTAGTSAAVKVGVARSSMR
jgi:solute carrier family 25 citrate transporter 1